MKIYRAITTNEKKALLENNSIFLKHKTCKNEGGILFPHPEDYETGKFFFLSFEDALNFGKYTYTYFLKSFSIIELDIDENIVYKYIGYGVYNYTDYTDDGKYDFKRHHAIAELLLPYNLIKDKIKNKEYQIEDFNFSSRSNEICNFKMPYDKDRPKYHVLLGKTIHGYLSSKRNKEYYEKELLKGNNDSFFGETNEQALERSTNEFEKYNKLLPEVFEKFVIENKVNEFKINNKFYLLDTSNLNKELLEYIDENILPWYLNFDGAHNLDHILTVIMRSFDIVHEFNLDLNLNMVYLVAAYHDLGMKIERKNHSTHSKELMLADNNLLKWFTPEEIAVMGDAVEDHSTSRNQTPRSEYGMIANDADIELDLWQSIERALNYTLNKNPEDSITQHAKNIQDTMIKRFKKDENGNRLLKVYFEGEKIMKFVEDMEQLCDNFDDLLKMVKDILKSKGFEENCKKFE